MVFEFYSVWPVARVEPISRLRYSDAMKKSIVTLIIILAIIVVVLVLRSGRPMAGDNAGTPSPSLGLDASSVATGLGGLSPAELERLIPNSMTVDDYKQFTMKATCFLTGSVEFTSSTISKNVKGELNWTGIDHDGRLINWTVSPADANLLIGPNLFAGRTIPDGSSLVGVTLKGTPKAKRYTLTASVQYGRYNETKNDIDVTNAPCSGSTSVIIGY